MPARGAPFSWIENGPALLGLVTLSFIIRKIITADGNVIGHVADIELTPAPEFKVTGLFYGRRGWLHRLHLVNPFGSRKRHKPDRVPWDAVERLEKSAIRLKPGVNVRDWAALE